MSVTVTLSKPISHSGVTVDSLTLTTPTAGALRRVAHAKTDIEAAFLMLSSMADVPPGAIDKLSIPDLGKILEAVAQMIKGN